VTLWANALGTLADQLVQEGMLLDAATAILEDDRLRDRAADQKHLAVDNVKAVHTYQHLYSRTNPQTKLLPFLTFHFSRRSISAAQPEDTSKAATRTPTYPRLTHQLMMHNMEKTNFIKSYYFQIVFFTIFLQPMYTIYFWH
jgi:hypothetical protein